MSLLNYNRSSRRFTPLLAGIASLGVLYGSYSLGVLAAPYVYADNLPVDKRDDSIGEETRFAEDVEMAALLNAAARKFNKENGTNIPKKSVSSDLAFRGLKVSKDNGGLLNYWSSTGHWHGFPTTSGDMAATSIFYRNNIRQAADAKSAVSMYLDESGNAVAEDPMGHCQSLMAATVIGSVWKTDATWQTTWVDQDDANGFPNYHDDATKFCTHVYRKGTAFVLDYIGEPTAEDQPSVDGSSSSSVDDSGSDNAVSNTSQQVGAFQCLAPAQQQTASTESSTDSSNNSGSPATVGSLSDATEIIKNGPKIFWVGDSITYMSKEYGTFKSMMPGVEVDGLSSRQLNGGVSPDGMTVIKGISSNPEVLVVSLGTNDASQINDKNLQAIMDNAPSSVKHFVFVVTASRGGGSGYGSIDVKSVQSNMKSFASGKSNVHVIDWLAEFDGKGYDNSLFSDTVHYTAEGDKTYMEFATKELAGIIASNFGTSASGGVSASGASRVGGVSVDGKSLSSFLSSLNPTAGSSSSDFIDPSKDLDFKVRDWTNNEITNWHEGIPSPAVAGSNGFSGLKYGEYSVDEAGLDAMLWLAVEMNTPPSFIISQKYLESMWGNSRVAQADNNWGKLTVY